MGFNTEKYRYYLGMGIEYQVISKFFLLGFEAYKLPIDFGFDIHVTNKMIQTYKEEEPQKDFYIQVKSRVILPPSENPNKETVVRFYIKKEDFNNLIKKSDSVLILYYVSGVKTYNSYFYDPVEWTDWNCYFYGKIEGYKMDLSEYSDITIHDYLWLNSQHLNYLMENDFVLEDEKNGGYYLETVYYAEQHSVSVSKNKEKFTFADNLMELRNLVTGNFENDPFLSK